MSKPRIVLPGELFTEEKSALQFEVIYLIFRLCFFGRGGFGGVLFANAFWGLFHGFLLRVHMVLTCLR